VPNLSHFSNFIASQPKLFQAVRQLDKRAGGGAGLAVSPDGRTALIGLVDDAGGDIMLVENFH